MTELNCQKEKEQKHLRVRDNKICQKSYKQTRCTSKAAIVTDKALFACVLAGTHVKSWPWEMVNNQPAAALHFIKLLLQSGTLLLLLLQLPLHHTELLLSFTFNVIGYHHCSLQVSLETPPLLCVLLERAITTQTAVKTHLVIDLYCSDHKQSGLSHNFKMVLGKTEHLPLYTTKNTAKETHGKSSTPVLPRSPKWRENEDLKGTESISSIVQEKHNASTAIKAQLSFVLEFKPYLHLLSQSLQLPLCILFLFFQLHCFT